MSDSAAAIAIVGIVFTVGGAGFVACVWLWAWRGRASADHGGDYKKLAEDMSNAQRRAAFELGQIAEDVGDMRARIVELERMLREVE